MELPKETISTREAAEAILLMHALFEPVPQIDAWIAELQPKYPDLAAMLFTASRDE